MRELNLGEIKVASGGDIPPMWDGQQDLREYLFDVENGPDEFKPSWWVTPMGDPSSEWYMEGYINDYMNAYTNWVMNNFFGWNAGC